MKIGEGRHLTYSSNVHPARSLDELIKNLDNFSTPLRDRLSRGEPFGVGLWIPANLAQELVSEARKLDALRQYLSDRSLYCFTLNGFPYGTFHGERVKDRVFAPDWRDPARVEYTTDLCTILEALLPPGSEGSISTLPLSFKSWVQGDESSAFQHAADHLIRIVQKLVQLRERSDTFIHLDLEPEPNGLIETSLEIIKFFDEYLLPGARKMLGLSRQVADQIIRAHIQICYDTCHQAVEFEPPREFVKSLTENRIRIGKMQLSSALSFPIPASIEERDKAVNALGPFIDQTYLHQVFAGPGEYLGDLEEALPRIADIESSEWRVHYHIPIYLDRISPLLGTTQNDLREALHLLQGTSFTNHLEIETYTWEILPAELKRNLIDGIEAEYRWVLNEFEKEPC